MFAPAPPLGVLCLYKIRSCASQVEWKPISGDIRSRKTTVVILVYAPDTHVAPILRIAQLYDTSMDASPVDHENALANLPRAPGHLAPRFFSFGGSTVIPGCPGPQQNQLYAALSVFPFSVNDGRDEKTHRPVTGKSRWNA